MKVRKWALGLQHSMCKGPEVGRRAGWSTEDEVAVRGRVGGPDGTGPRGSGQCRGAAEGVLPVTGRMDLPRPSWLPHGGVAGGRMREVSGEASGAGTSRALVAWGTFPGRRLACGL